MGTKAWTWESGCCSGERDNCHGTTTVGLDGDRVEFRGFCADPSYGGGYWIADQSVGELVANGPARPVPQHVLEQISRPEGSRPAGSGGCPPGA